MTKTPDLVVPDARSLREAALAHLARFATTEQGLRQLLERRIRRWGARATRAGQTTEEIETVYEALRPAIEEIVRSMTGLGAVDDAQFARSRARSLTRTGRSRRAVAAHLANKGVDQGTSRAALDDSLGERSEERAHDTELAAALVLARKRRLGPFRREDRPDEDPMKALAVFARNGFGRDIAQTALDMDPAEAEDRIIVFRSL